MSQNEKDKNYEGWEKSPDSSLFVPKSMSQNEDDKNYKGWKKGLLIIFFGLVVVALVIWGVIEVFNWWFNRTIGSSDDWSGVWVFGLGVFAMFFIWNMFD
jgi:hypothetical protein